MNLGVKELSFGCCGMWDVGAASRGDYVQDERYIARSTWMCGAMVSVLHTVEKIAARRASHIPHPTSHIPQPAAIKREFFNLRIHVIIPLLTTPSGGRGKYDPIQSLFSKLELL
jgi:hypothetical protein